MLTVGTLLSLEDEYCDDAEEDVPEPLFPLFGICITDCADEAAELLLSLSEAELLSEEEGLLLSLAEELLSLLLSLDEELFSL